MFFACSLSRAPAWGYSVRECLFVFTCYVFFAFLFAHMPVFIRHNSQIYITRDINKKA